MEPDDDGAVATEEEEPATEETPSPARQAAIEAEEDKEAQRRLRASIEELVTATVYLDGEAIAIKFRAELQKPAMTGEGAFDELTVKAKLCGPDLSDLHHRLRRYAGLNVDVIVLPIIPPALPKPGEHPDQRDLPFAEEMAQFVCIKCGAKCVAGKDGLCPEPDCGGTLNALAEQPSAEASRDGLDGTLASTLATIEHVLARIEELPEAGQEFGDSVTETLEVISETIEDTDRVTEAQTEAIANIRAGVEKWFENE